MASLAVTARRLNGLVANLPPLTNSRICREVPRFSPLR